MPSSASPAASDPGDPADPATRPAGTLPPALLLTTEAAIAQRACPIGAGSFVESVTTLPRRVQMPHYLMSVLSTSPAAATPEEDAAIDVFNDALRAGGHWVFAGGLGEPDGVVVVDGRDGEPLFTDGPYVESKEFLAGFWIVEAPDPETARRLAAEGSRACNRRVELRPFL